MARYFGGFRDRLKKRSKHLPITVKDVEWIKVATTFTWSPARREYQWLEPEDYLSSFLNSSDNTFDPPADLSQESQGDGSINVSTEMAFTGNEYDGSESLIGMPAHEKDEDEDGKIPYIPPYDYTLGENGQAEDGVLRPNINVPAELPLLDEYKLEIVSALLRRGIRVGVEKIKLPHELANQLNEYHEGRVSIDSYELRSRLQKFKKQVIESFEHFSSFSSPIRSAPIDVTQPPVDEVNEEEEDTYLILEPFEEEDEELTDAPFQQASVGEIEASVQESSATPAAGEEDYESFILSSLNRLEASMNEVDQQDEVVHEVPGTETSFEAPTDLMQDPDEVAETPGRPIRNTRTVDTPQNTSDIVAEGTSGSDLKEFTNQNDLPSSFADDSWLVLPVDSRKAGLDLENPEDGVEGPFVGEADIEEAEHPQDLLEAFEEDDPHTESTRADSSDLLKALNTINSRFLDSSTDEELDLNVNRDIFDEQEMSAASPHGIEGPGDIKEEVTPVVEETSPLEIISSESPALESPALEPEKETPLSELLLQLRNDSNLAQEDLDIESPVENASITDSVPANVEPVYEDVTRGYERPPSSDEPALNEPALNEPALNEPAREEDGFDEPDTSVFENGPSFEDVIQQATASVSKPMEPAELAEPEPEQAESSSETVEQQRARYIEQEREKLYSLIDDLEEQTPEEAPRDDGMPPADPEPVRAQERLQETLQETLQVTPEETPQETEKETKPEISYSPEDLKAELARLRASVELNRRSALNTPEPQPPTPELTEPSVPVADEVEKSLPQSEIESVSESVESDVPETETVDVHKNLIDPEPGTLDLMSNLNGEIESEADEIAPKEELREELVSPESTDAPSTEPAPVRSFGSLDLAVTNRIADQVARQQPTSPEKTETQKKETQKIDAPPKELQERSEPVSPTQPIPDIQQEKHVEPEAANQEPVVKSEVREESSQNEPPVSLRVSEPVSSDERIRRLTAEIEKQRKKQSASVPANVQRKFVTKDTEAGTESVQVHSESKDQRAMAEPQTTEQETTPASTPAEPVKPEEQPEAAVPNMAYSDDKMVHDEKVDEGMTAVVSASTEVKEEEDLIDIREDEGLIEAEEALENDVPLTGVIESLAFATEDPIPLKKIARIYSELLGVRQPTEKMMRDALKTLNDHYTETGRSYRIKEWAGGVRMASHPQYARFIRAIYQDHRPKKLSRTLMETLAIIAYSQPTTKPEVDFVRGVDSDYAVRKLLELGLIDIVGRSESIGRPLLYGTSERFLEQFGLSEIEALPKLREVEDLLGDPAFKKERLQLLALEEMEVGSEGDGAASPEAAAPAAENAVNAEAGENKAPNKPAQPDAAAGDTAGGASS